MRKLILVALLTFSAPAFADSLLSVVDKAIKQAVMKETNNPVAVVRTNEIIRPIHILTALRHHGVTNTKLTEVITGVAYNVRYTFMGAFTA